MEANFWLDKWDREEIGFHMNDVNPVLIKHWDDFFNKTSSAKTILVPLCGKTIDLLFFAKQGLKVIGVELSEKAILAFFSENKLDYTLIERDDFKIYKAESLNITIYLSDILKLTKEQLDQIDIIYDRASIVALPLEIRTKYLQWIDAIRTKETKILMNTLEFDAPLGPPFSISQEMISEYFTNKFDIQCVSTNEVPQEEIRIHKESISWLKSHTFFLL